MKRLSLAALGAALFAGCQVQGQPPESQVTPATLPRASAPEITLHDVRLGTTVKAIAPLVRDRVVDDMKFRAAEAGSPGSEVTVQLVTVGDLKSQNQFRHSYLSDDSQVILATSEGRFEVAGAAGSAGKAYGRLLGMFDPASGETLALAYTP